MLGVELPFRFLLSNFRTRAPVLLSTSPVAALHFLTKGQREVVNEMVRKLIICEMGNFTPDRFKDWFKNMDNQFRKMALMLQFEIRDRVVHFTVKELRTGRRVYHFATSTRVTFEQKDVVISFEEITGRFAG